MHSARLLAVDLNPVTVGIGKAFGHAQFLAQTQTGLMRSARFSRWICPLRFVLAAVRSGTRFEFAGFP